MTIEVKNQYKRTVTTDTLNILSGETTSNLLDCGGVQARGLLFPSNWTSCNVSIKPAIIDNDLAVYTLSDVDGTSLSMATVADQWLPLLPWLTDAPPYFQISCSVAQASDVIVTVVLEPLYQGVHG